jgi:hypothetical protein
VLRSTFAFLLISLSVIACESSTDDDSIAGPPPSEPTVFAASEQTKAELGIAQWGVDVGSESGTDKAATFRGYAGNNEVLVTVVQRDEYRTDHATLTMSMTGPLATASQKIELYAVDGPSKGLKTTMMRVPENTMGQEAPKHVLERFAADAKDAKASGTTTGSTLLAGRSRPLDEALVTYCNPAANPCSETLIQAHVALAGTAKDCGFENLIGEAAVGCGVGLVMSAIPTLGVGAIPGCIGGALTPVVWNGYQCVTSRTEAREKKNAYADCEAAKCGGTPRGECDPDANGYSCSSDPSSQRDRACCNGSCVIWAGSACDR